MVGVGSTTPNPKPWSTAVVISNLEVSIFALHFENIGGGTEYQTIPSDTKVIKLLFFQVSYQYPIKA